MQNKDGKKFTRKKGAMLILSLCLVGGAAFTTFYTMNRAEKAKEEQEQLVDLNEEARQEDAEEEDAAKATEQETDAQRVNNADKASADTKLYTDSLYRPVSPGQ